MKLFSILAFCVALVAASDLKSFILEIKDPDLRWDMLAKLAKTPGGIPASLEQILIQNNIPYPGMKTKYVFKDMEKLSASELQTITYYLDEFYREQEYKAKYYVPPVVKGRKPGIPCNVDDDCPPQQFCFNLKDALANDLDRHNASSHLNFVIQALGVKDKECSLRMSDFILNNASRAIPTLKSSYNKILAIFDKMRAHKGMEHFLNEVEGKIFKKFDFKLSIETGLAKTRRGFIGQDQYHQQSSSSSMSPLLLLFALGGDSTELGYILPLLMLDGGGGGGGMFGGDMLSNPLMLMLFLGGKDGITDKILPIMLLSAFAGGKGGSKSMLPLIFLLMKNSTESIFPLLMAMGGLDVGGGGYDDGYFRRRKRKASGYDDSGGYGVGNSEGYGVGGAGYGGGHDDKCKNDMGSDPFTTMLLFSSLFNDKNDSDSDHSLSKFMPLLLLGNQGCTGSGGIGIMEILLLTGLGGNSSMGGSKSLPLLLIMSGLGGKGGQPDNSLLLLFLLGGDLFGSGNSILPLLFMSDGNFLDNPLALYYLFSGHGNSSSGLSSLLMISLFLSGGNSGLSKSQTISVSPHGVSAVDPYLPPPGGPLSGHGSYVSNSPPPGHGLKSGLFGKQSGMGIFEILIFSGLFEKDGDKGGMDTTTLMLILLMTNGGLGVGLGGGHGGGLGGGSFGGGGGNQHYYPGPAPGYPAPAPGYPDLAPGYPGQGTGHLAPAPGYPGQSAGYSSQGTGYSSQGTGQGYLSRASQAGIYQDGTGCYDVNSGSTVPCQQG